MRRQGQGTKFTGVVAIIGAFVGGVVIAFQFVDNVWLDAVPAASAKHFVKDQSRLEPLKQERKVVRTANDEAQTAAQIKVDLVALELTETPAAQTTARSSAPPLPVLTPRKAEPASTDVKIVKTKVKKVKRQQAARKPVEKPRVVKAEPQTRPEQPKIKLSQPKPAKPKSFNIFAEASDAPSPWRSN